MTYSTTELMKKTGYTRSTITNLFKRMGLQPIEIGNSNTKIWEEKSLQILLKYKDKRAKAKNVSVEYLAYLFGISNQTVRDILRTNKIEVAYMDKSRDFYPREAMDILKMYFDAAKRDEVSEHPLVTDKRCLILGWFPETMPKCFEDLDK